MDYITIIVNKKFLIITGLLIGVVYVSVGAYKIGYSKGVAAAFAYVDQVTRGKSFSS